MVEVFIVYLENSIMLIKITFTQRIHYVLTFVSDLTKTG